VPFLLGVVARILLNANANYAPFACAQKYLRTCAFRHRKGRCSVAFPGFPVKRASSAARPISAGRAAIKAANKLSETLQKDRISFRHAGRRSRSRDRPRFGNRDCDSTSDFASRVSVCVAAAVSRSTLLSQASARFTHFFRYRHNPVAYCHAVNVNNARRDVNLRAVSRIRATKQNINQLRQACPRGCFRF